MLPWKRFRYSKDWEDFSVHTTFFDLYKRTHFNFFVITDSCQIFNRNTHLGSFWPVYIYQWYCFSNLKPQIDSHHKSTYVAKYWVFSSLLSTWFSKFTNDSVIKEYHTTLREEAVYPFMSSAVTPTLWVYHIISVLLHTYVFTYYPPNQSLEPPV